MKIIRIEFHVESDDDGDTESVGRAFSCYYEESVKRYRELFDATCIAFDTLESDICKHEMGEPKKTVAGNYRRLAEKVAELYRNLPAGTGVSSLEIEVLLDEFLGDTWRK